MMIGAPSRSLAVPRPSPSSVRPKAPTLIASPAPPSPGSKFPPPRVRARAASVIDLRDDDIVESSPSPAVRRSTPPPPPRAKKARRDPLEVAREAIGELGYLATAAQAASVCAAAVAKALGARAVIIHTHDPRTSEIRIVGAAGAKSAALVGAAALVEDDFVASTVVWNKKPMKMFIDGTLPRVAPERMRAVGASRSLVAAPASAKGDVLAMIEVVDPEEKVAAKVEAVVDYAAKALAAFLAASKQ